MLINKCKYYNNHQTACSLMIDDLVPVAVYPFDDDKVSAKYDWGYLMNGENSLCRFFHDNLLQKFPSIKGTFFIPLKSHLLIDDRSGYRVFKRDYDDDYINFLNTLTDRFDFAFHGITHSVKRVVQEGHSKGKNRFEFENLSIEDIPYLKDEIDGFKEKTGIIFNGGKFPGYAGNDFSTKIIDELGFLWWASSAGMINRKTRSNACGYLGNQQKTVDIPTNISGDIYNLENLKNRREKTFRAFLSRIKRKLLHISPDDYLAYLIQNQLPLTIQEHFQNQRTDGKRQTPNIFDDILPLNKIFCFLSDHDVWYATCSELAQYFESYNNTDIEIINKTEINIKYTGRWHNMFLSFYSSSDRLKSLKTRNVVKGIPKNSMWIYNDLKEGKYMLI